MGEVLPCTASLPTLAGNKVTDVAPIHAVSAACVVGIGNGSLSVCPEGVEEAIAHPSARPNVLALLETRRRGMVKIACWAGSDAQNDQNGNEELHKGHHDQRWFYQDLGLN